MATKTYVATFAHSLSEAELAYQVSTSRSPGYFEQALQMDTILIASLLAYPRPATCRAQRADPTITHSEQSAGDSNPAPSRVVGYIQISDVRLQVTGIHPSEQDQAIHALYVDPEFQRRGIGSRLLESALQHPRLRTAQRVFLDVWDENARAITFYRSHGFELSGTTDVVINGTVIGQDLVMSRGRHGTQSSGTASDAPDRAQH